MKKPILEFENAEGAKYRIYWRRIKKKDLKGLKCSAANGLCYSPDSKRPKIIIEPKLKNKKELQVLIEEYYHSENFDHTEKKARHFARVLTELIVLLGWRKTNE